MAVIEVIVPSPDGLLTDLYEVPADAHRIVYLPRLRGDGAPVWYFIREGNNPERQHDAKFVSRDMLMG